MNKLQEQMFLHFKEVVNLLEENNIKYFAIGGTAIGAIRENGFIEWDDDIDIAIFEDDMDKFHKLMTESKFTMTDEDNHAWRPFYKIGSPDVNMESYGKTIKMNIDIFIAWKKRKIKKRTFILRDALRFLMWIKTNKGSFLRQQEREKGNKVVWLWWLGICIPKFLIPVGFRKSRWQKRMFKIIRNKKIIDDGKSYFYHSDPFHKVLTLDASKIEYVTFEDGEMAVTSRFAEESVPVYGDIMVPYRDSKNGGQHGYKIAEDENKEVE